MSFFKPKPHSSPLSRFRLAIKSSDTVGIREILAANPDLLNYRDEKGMTPLHWAAEAQDLWVVAALVDMGADVSIKDNLGYTPRDVAYWFGEFHMGAYTDVCHKIVERLNERPHQA
jgi:ankyrin repeat protein